MKNKDIDKIRKEIDKLDSELLELLNRRAKQVIEMGRLKSRLGIKVFDPRRERDIFINMTEKNPGPLTVDAIVRIFERIIDESRRLERIEAFERDSDS